MVKLFQKPFSCFCLILLLLASSISSARATHIVGGEMELQYKSGSTYTLSLNLYFDVINGNPDAEDLTLTAGIFDKATNRRMALVVLQRLSRTPVQYTNPACTVSSLSTRKIVYSADVTLPAATYTSTAGYYAAVERCCRNQTISNIVSPLTAAQTFYLEFPAVVRNGQSFVDSTPRIFPPLGDYACRSELFYYDFGGQDADGDSLVYDMVTPLNGHSSSLDPAPTPEGAPYTTVTWTTGLGTQNQIPGNPTLGIDAHTGRLTVRPSQLGLFVFGVRCSEYRKGVKIGETRRDFQIYVLNCPQNTAPSLQLFTAATGARAYNPAHDTLKIKPGSDHCIRLRYTDADANSRLTVSAVPVNFTSAATGPSFTTATSGTVRAAGSPDTLTATLCFPECFDTKKKVYLLDLVVADNGCSLPKRDTVRLAFMAEPLPNIPAVLTTSFQTVSATGAIVPVRVPLGSTYTATLTGTDADKNPLVLSAQGQGFDLAAMGMSFTAQNGNGTANGLFQWQATCDAAQVAETLTVVFQLQETSSCEKLAYSRTVQFEVVPATDTLSFLPPNVITPNGDGLNDVFTIPSLPADFCDVRFAGIKIFSRWGNEVYRSPERTFRWSGIGSSGVYYYLITYTDGRKYKGTLTVLP
ncbi:gliding motility-associated C-terminal domain-containing protein [Hymenobacter sp. GOD-10R]|uniref:gliding motility-associated C-terminal domain-containing protein n=1 Tax=Hymenobacter sp. GOD-10R TaxID=3093922 RepID=UPI002D77F24A|nr:gliding motility-associated C-terminal domain-containing protein [Hymenobacter sp. GOD-10R]WRQ29257.1 gliding motility-associated C-terminal domain-containing protein [Hymenobacter sp. GOD-10R]